MRYRKLRIAWSVVWGVAAVLLCVIWVRSYWRWDVVYLPDNRMPQLAPTMFWTTEVASHRGQLTLARGLLVFGNEAWKWTIAPEINDGPVIPPPSVLGFRYKERAAKTSRRPSEYVFVVPYYFPFFLTSSLSLAPWVRHLPRRFSLRTLLIATTLVAVVLGLIVWLR
jgi:hypothetical protein